MINNIFCYILTLIPSGHQASSFLILGIESIIYKWLCYVFLFGEVYCLINFFIIENFVYILR
jgi:hypothetical protein